MIQIAANEFRKTAGAAAIIMERRNTIPILGSALLRSDGDGNLDILTTDLDIYSRFRTEARGGAYSVAIPSIGSICQALRHCGSDDIVIRRGDKAGAVVDMNGHGAVEIDTLAHEDFPETAWDPDKVKWEILAPPRLFAAMARARRAASNEETRYYLNGVYVHAGETEHSVNLVASDGHRLVCEPVHLLDCDPKGQLEGAIIPKKVCDLLMRVAETAGNRPMRMQFAGMNMRFTVGDDIEIIAKLIDGTFPDYSRVVPVDKGREHKAVINREGLLRAVRIASCFGTDRTKAIRLDIEKDSVQVSMKSQDEGRYSGSPVPAKSNAVGMVGFNNHYLLDMLALFSDDQEIVIETCNMHPSGTAHPVLFSGAGTDTVAVLMPMRV